MMLAGKLFRDGQDNSGQVLDSNDLEKERGITILSKNVSINWKGTKINIIDTPLLRAACPRPVSCCRRLCRLD